MSKMKTKHIIVANSGISGCGLLGINTKTGMYSWADSLSKLLQDLTNTDPRKYQGNPALPMHYNWANDVGKGGEFTRVVIG